MFLRSLESSRGCRSFRRESRERWVHTRAAAAATPAVVRLMGDCLTRQVGDLVSETSGCLTSVERGGGRGVFLLV